MSTAVAPPLATFPLAEYEARLERTRARMRERGLDGLLLFAQESLFYLTGYDTSGYVFFQCAVLPVDGPITLLTRRPDLAQARDTSTIEDVRIWYNAEDANPAAELRAIAAEKGLAGARLGVEFATYGLTAANWRSVETEFTGFATLVDASDLVRDQRLVKSPAELVHVREAGRLADLAMEAARAAARPGKLSGDMAGAILATTLAHGGDLPSEQPIVNSGPRAVYGRGVLGAHPLEENDQVLVEFGASHRRYMACIERTVILGHLSEEHATMFKVVRATMEAMIGAIRAGAPLSDIDAEHRRVLDASGFGADRYGACGYSLGATFAPTWMDVPPMIYSGNPLVMQPGMVLFPHAMLGAVDSRRAVGMGHTVIVTETGCEQLSRLPFEPLFA
ncbi:aminopeptidase P family protein [Ancylobacter sonchi]|uniref:M24 family metallopeptidase n=1 Tax=Ancylobacter sonchi TaxID=1937790 RepID=UPI001BD2532B|nr:Xaa-Pro peptidase family protein [Ancylobacter sonchi]MBS7534145.1 aminopeptidase P family protein [Ancylobacter sonchi]